MKAMYSDFEEFWMPEENSALYTHTDYLEHYCNPKCLRLIMAMVSIANVVPT